MHGFSQDPSVRGVTPIVFRLLGVDVDQEPSDTATMRRLVDPNTGTSNVKRSLTHIDVLYLINQFTLERDQSH